MFSSGEKFSKKIYLIPIVFPVISLVTSCIILSSKKYFWYDELVPYYLVTDKSIFHMLKALADQVDTVPPFYYILAWCWAKLFGGTELSLRIFSCLGICIACSIIYLVLYKIYKFWPSFIGTLTVFCGSRLILHQNAEAKLYGLFLAICALATFLYYKACSATNISLKTLIFLSLVHGAMVLTHPYGFWYSAIMIISLVVRDRYFKLSRPKIYLSIILGWFIFIPWIPSYINQLNILKDDFWIRKTNFGTLFDLYGFGISFFPHLIIVIITIIFIKWKKLTDNFASSLDVPNEDKKNIEISFFFLTYALLTIPALSWLVSRLVRPIFIYRYFLPSAMAWSFLLAPLLFTILHLSSYFSGKHFTASIKTKILLIAISTTFLSHPLIEAMNFPVKERPGLNNNRYGYTDLPIVSAGLYTNAMQFLPELYYSANSSRYFYLLDNEVSAKSSSLYMNKEMAALGRNYLPNNVMQAQEFLLINKSFLILRSQEWFEARIKNNPKYQYKILERGKLILVQKILNNGD